MTYLFEAIGTTIVFAIGVAIFMWPVRQRAREYQHRMDALVEAKRSRS